MTAATQMHDLRPGVAPTLLRLPSKRLTQDNALAVDHGSAVKSWAYLIAGASGGLATAILTSPLDIVRTRLQSNLYRPQLFPNRALRSPSPFHPFRFSLRHIHETSQLLFSIHRVEGWRALFRGLGPGVVGLVPASAIKFYTYGNCKRLVSETTKYGKDATIVHIVAAATAGVVTSTATNPIWLVKTRLQLDISHAEREGGVTARRYKNSLDCISQVLQREGYRGLFRGLSASYLGVAESSLHLVWYERIKISFARREQGLVGAARDRTSWDQVAGWIGMSGAAGASKLLAALMAYPHEVVRTRLRQAPMENGVQKYTSLVQCFRLVWKEEGLISMYSGLTPHLLRAVPSAAITLGVYEFVLALFNAQS